VQEIDDLLVERKDQVLETGGGTKQAVLIAEVLAEPYRVGQFALLEPELVVADEQVGVDSTEVPDPFRVGHKALVHAQVAHALPHDLEDERAAEQRVLALSAPLADRLPRLIHVAQPARIDFNQVGPVVTFPDLAVDHQEVDVLGRPSLLLPALQRRAGPVPDDRPLIGLLQDFPEPADWLAIDSPADGGPVLPEVLHGIDRLAVLVRGIALCDPFLQGLWPDIVPQTHARHGTTVHQTINDLGRGRHRCPRCCLVDGSLPMGWDVCDNIQ